MRGTGISVALLIFAVTGFAQDETPAPAEGTSDVAKLIAAFQEATGSQAKRKAIGQLYAAGDAAMKAVEAQYAEAKKAADAAADDAKREANKAFKRARKVRDAMYMQIVVNDFERLRKAHPDSSLTFAGQFSHLKKHGRRAAIGALALMKDIGLHSDQNRMRAWEVLADLGDESVKAELKEIATDYLYEDAVQRGAASALAALGDTSAIEAKVEELKKAFTQRQDVRVLQDIALTYSHARQYKKATETYDKLIGHLRMIEEKNGDNMKAENLEGLRGFLANVYYNSACTHSLMKDLGNAYAKLGECLKIAKDRYIKLIPRDGDFRNLRADAKYATWLANAKKGEFPPKPADKKPAKPADGAEPNAPDSEPAKPADPPPPAGGGESGQTTGATAPVAAAAAHVLEPLVDRWLAADTNDADRAKAVESLAAAGPVAARAILARASANPAATALYDAVCMRAIANRFSTLRNASPERSLTFAGQFDDLKAYGRGAAPAALKIFKDYDQNMQDRRWAADALADLRDPSVVAELRAIAEDYLYEDEIQEMAAFALAALGKPKMLEKKIDALERQRESSGGNSLTTIHRIARLHYRGRQYESAISRYRQVIRGREAGLEQRDAELSDEARKGWHRHLASLYYSLACNQSLHGQPKDAMKTLDACKRYDRDGQYLKSLAIDGDLRKVREHRDYRAWLARATGQRPVGLRRDL